MQRQIVWTTALLPLLALGLTLLVSPATAETSGRSTLADRIEALKQGFTNSVSKKPAEETQELQEAPAADLPIPQAMPSTPKPAAVAPEQSVAVEPGVLPRVDPRELLPRRWFGAEGMAPIDAAGNPESTLSVNANSGSTRARLLREQRKAASESDSRIAGRPTTEGRAGSAFGPTATGPAAGKPTTPASPSADAALARSIASDVANSLADEKSVEDESEVEQQPNTKAPASEDSTEMSVAENPEPTTKLPMFIGEGYDQSRSTTSMKQRVQANKTGNKPREIKVPKTAIPNDDPALLLTQKTPVLVSRVRGPRTIVVGREASYEVHLANRGDIEAEQVITTIRVPEWAEVADIDAPSGKVETQLSSGSEGTLLWRLDRLGMNKAMKLKLKLIARSGRPIALGVTAEHKPIDGSTIVQVQEPKLELELTGPDDVFFGKSQVFRLTLANPGTGTAEDVTLRLTPPGGDPGRATSHQFGSLEAGGSRTVEIELTAREAGRLAVLASATATGDIAAEITKEIFCRKPELAVDWRGPKDRYAGAPAVYYFRVHNPGTAAASEVELSVNLPAGFDLLPGEATPQVDGQKLVYRVGSLQPGAERFFELRGVFNRAGANDLAIRAEGSDETASEVVRATTEVVALADLKLEVLDPKGPIATGEEATYQIRVINRGSNEAREVRVVGLFSAGIEPHHADGGASSINDGRVAFDTIASLPAGGEQVFTIHARAHEEGTHLFRAEVLCRDLEIKLAAEETTRFFEDEAVNVAGESGYGYSR